jgi:hypothetical protein
MGLNLVIIIIIITITAIMIIEGLLKPGKRLVEFQLIDATFLTSGVFDLK